MTNIATPVSAIQVIQYKLDDYEDGKPKSMDDVGCERLTQNPQMTGFSQIVLLDDDHFGVLHPVCPECGSRKYVKNGFRERHPILGDFGKITVYVQRYICRKCGKGFSANIDGIIEKGRWFARRFKEMANSLAAIMKYSSRTTRQVFLALFGVSPSHQTIENWLSCKIPELPASGHYSYDEQCIKLKGKKAFRLTLVDIVVNVPIADEVSYTLNAEVVLDFLERNLKGKPVYSITTDDRKWYRKIAKKLKAIHQLCGFHFLKNITEDADYYFNSKSLSDTEKIRLAIFVSAIREVFCSFTEKDFLEKLENVYAMKDAVPSLIKKHIDKLVKDVDLYTNHLWNPQIPKTSNDVEEYYRQTDPRKMKKRYQTPQGLTQALNQKAVYWIVRHSFIPEEVSLQIARQNMSKRYNKDNIHKVFSKKKKHVLKYWMGDPTQ